MDMSDMQNNIFENAYFGKPYKTRDGRKAIYLGWSTFDNDVWCRFISEDKEEFEILRANGKARFDTVELDRDIIGEWEEPISEEELDEMAIEEKNKYKEQLPFHYEFPHSESDLNIRGMGFIDGFKTAYRKLKKALEE